MTALILAILGKAWPYLIGAAALAFGALKVRQSGVKAERAKQAQAEAKARDVADQVDNDVGALPGADARKELGKWAR